MINAWHGGSDDGDGDDRGGAGDQSEPANETIVSEQTVAPRRAGTTPLTYQWYVGTSGATNAPIAGATASSYTTPPLTTESHFWVRVTNSYGAADSATAIVTIGAGPAFTTHPFSQTVGSGQSASLSVIATGDAPLSYQWYLGPSGTTTSPVAGAIDASFTTPALTTDTNYWVRATNPYGSVDSTTAAITIGLPPTITTLPQSPTVTAGHSANLSLVAMGTAPLTYQCDGFPDNHEPDSSDRKQLHDTRADRCHELAGDQRL